LRVHLHERLSVAGLQPLVTSTRFGAARGVRCDNPMSSRTRRLLLAAAESDATFERVSHRDGEYWVGKCIHCQSRVSVPLAANEPAHATLEHIIPKTHGGSDALENLAVACQRCNQGKGTRLDHRPRHDPKLREVIETLQARRRARLRQPQTGRAT
jgi:5-methylcytosine-specific restriction endonuclease McrA